MEALRLATPEEVAKISEGLDLTQSSTVVAFPKKDGDPDLAVLRQVTELDPVIFSEGTDDRRKAMFIWAIESGLKILGIVPEIYFNVDANDTKWQHVIETFGGVQTSKHPELRYKKSLK